MNRTPPPWAWLERTPPHLRRFAENDLWERETIATSADRLAQAVPDAIALVDGDRSISRAALVTGAEALAAALQRRGLEPGDVVAFQVPNWAEAATINLACAIAGLVVNPIVPIYRDAEVRQMLGDCRARVLFAAAKFRGFDFAEMARRIRPDLPFLDHVFTVRGEGENDLAALLEDGRGRSPRRARQDEQAVKMVLYTSGTTGRPKGVLHSHATLGRVIRRSAQHWKIRDSDAVLMPSPVTHVSGYANGLDMPLLVGTTSILIESWDASAALTLIEKHRVVGTVAATPFLIELATAARAAGSKVPSLRFFACGGAAVPPEVIPAANAAFERCHAFRVFGSSEVPLVTLGWPDDSRRAAITDGEVVDYEVLIVDANNRPLPVGCEGEILARGPAMFLGYADEGQTAEAISVDGFFRTGDLGMLDAAKAVTITGRKKDLIIRGGENISAKEIEDVLHLHPQVREASVVAMPHERLGEGVCAFIVSAGDAPLPAGLAAHVAASGLAKQKIPERFVFVDDLPRTASGKVRKDLLREAVKEIVRGLRPDPP